MHALARLTNAIVRAEQEVLTLTEHRLLLCALRCLHTSDEELPPVAFRMKDVLERINGNGRRLVHEGVRKLRKRQFAGEHLFKVLVADDATDTVRGIFNSVLAPHLLHEHLKKGGYTQVDLSSTAFTSVHAYRLFWLLSSYRGTTFKTYSLDDFRRVALGDADKYKTWNDLKRHVLEVVREQFEGAGFVFEYNEEMTKNKVTGVTIQVPDLTKKSAVVTPFLPAPFVKVAPPVGATNPEKINDFEEAIRQYPAYYHLYNRLQHKYKFPADVAEYAIHWITELPGEHEARVRVVEQVLKKVGHVSQFKKLSSVYNYTLKALREAKAEYLAESAERREKRENHRAASDSPILDSIATKLAIAFKA